MRSHDAETLAMRCRDAGHSGSEKGVSRRCLERPPSRVRPLRRALYYSSGTEEDTEIGKEKHHKKKSSENPATVCILGALYRKEFIYKGCL